MTNNEDALSRAVSGPRTAGERRTEPRFRLPPEVFDALHLSALAFGGMGCGDWEDCNGAPLCARGHAMKLDTDERAAGRTELVFPKVHGAGISIVVNDGALEDAGVRRYSERIPFERWCELVGVDVSEAAHG